MLRLRNIYEMTNRPVRQTTIGKLAGALGLASLLVVLFANIAEEILEGDTLGGDEAVLYRLNAMSTPLLDAVIPYVTDLGGPLFAIAIAIVLIFIYYRRKKWNAVLQIGVGLGGVGLLSTLLKLLFGRDRPQLWERLIDASNYSFPSGHAAFSSALALTIILLAWHTKYRTATLIAGCIYVIVIGLTRLYLGVHYPTDILAGWCLGFGWVLLVAALLGLFGKPKS
jgi:undecaprenyl-diphosphatase